VVGAVVFGYKVKVGVLGRIKNGLNGRPAGIGDGAWGKAGDLVSIIRRENCEILSGQVSVKILDTVDDGGVALKSHASLQAV